MSNTDHINNKNASGLVNEAVQTLSDDQLENVTGGLARNASSEAKLRYVYSKDEGPKVKTGTSGQLPKSVLDHMTKGLC